MNSSPQQNVRHKFEVGDFVILKKDFSLEEYQAETRGIEYRVIPFELLPKTTRLEQVSQTAIATIGKSIGKPLIVIRGAGYLEDYFELFQP